MKNETKIVVLAIAGLGDISRIDLQELLVGVMNAPPPAELAEETTASFIRTIEEVERHDVYDDLDGFEDYPYVNQGGGSNPFLWIAGLLAAGAVTGGTLLIAVTALAILL